MGNGRDDEQLLEMLREALRARQAVPPQFVETGKNAYAWHDIDTELAQLTYDSSRDEERSASIRSEMATVRALSFTSAHLSIELEVSEDVLLGQIVPPAEGTIEVQTKAVGTTAVPIDEIGCFSIEPIPPSPFRLRCRTVGGTEVVTGWITL